jgi:hypothetical protein
VAFPQLPCEDGTYLWFHNIYITTTQFHILYVKALLHSSLIRFSVMMQFPRDENTFPWLLNDFNTVQQLPPFIPHHNRFLNYGSSDQ